MSWWSLWLNTVSRFWERIRPPCSEGRHKDATLTRWDQVEQQLICIECFCSSLNWRGINSHGICLLPAHLLHIFWDLSWAITDNFANSFSVFPTSVFLFFFLNSCRVSWTVRLVDVPSDRLILRQSGERAGQQQRWLTGLLQQKAAQTKTTTGQPGLHPHIQRLRSRPRHRPRYASDPNRQPAWPQVKNQRQEAGPRSLLPRPGCATCGQLLPPRLPVSGWSAQTAAALRASYSICGQVWTVCFKKHWRSHWWGRRWWRRAFQEAQQPHCPQRSDQDGWRWAWGEVSSSGGELVQSLLYPHLPRTNLLPPGLSRLPQGWQNLGDQRDAGPNQDTPSQLLLIIICSLLFYTPHHQLWSDLQRAPRPGDQSKRLPTKRTNQLGDFEKLQGPPPKLLAKERSEAVTNPTRKFGKGRGGQGKVWGESSYTLY